MDGKRWWIIDEVARFWRGAPQEARWLLMQRVRDGAKEASLDEVLEGAIRAELEDQQADASAEIVEAWAAGKGVRRR